MNKFWFGVGWAATTAAVAARMVAFIFLEFIISIINNLNIISNIIISPLGKYTLIIITNDDLKIIIIT